MHTDVCSCSAGIGRTGSVLVIALLLSQLERQGPHTQFDIPSTILKVREMRPGLVQTETQFRFLYKALAAAVSSNQV